jgi:hypothetical protein
MKPAARWTVFLACFPALFAMPRPAVSQNRFPPVAELPSRPELPDPRLLSDGRRVTTKEQWFQERRPELKALFQHYMYGYLPPAPDKVQAVVERTDRSALDGKATLKELTLAFGPPEMPRIHLLLVVPNRRPGPAPVFVGINFHGNHAVVRDPLVRLPTVWVPNRNGARNNRATEAGRGSEADGWAVDQAIDRGYAVATFYNGDIDPDRADKREGVQPHLIKEGKIKPGPDACGTIAAWAWGVHRVVDYLITNTDIDKQRIAAVGHSRLGKATLVAAAFDERIALAVPLQAGCGGTAPSRGKVGESVKQINDRFPHWFDAVFKEFNDRPDRLPFDQHCLVALVAPRPVLFSNAVEDTWANPQGQFQVLQAADPVYRFLGVEGLEAKTMPEPGKLVASRLGYFVRPGKHSMTREDWKAFLDFADKQLGRKETSP